MIFYRCKCGQASAWSSMGVAACDVCPACGSTLGAGPHSHPEPVAHDFRPTPLDGADGLALLTALRTLIELLDQGLAVQRDTPAVAPLRALLTQAQQAERCWRCQRTRAEITALMAGVESPCR
jgi:hypothetical protein